jgi:hypothetical protein
MIRTVSRRQPRSAIKIARIEIIPVNTLRTIKEGKRASRPPDAGTAQDLEPGHLVA